MPRYVISLSDPMTTMTKGPVGKERDPVLSDDDAVRTRAVTDTD